jgi:hypothetical protein
MKVIGFHAENFKRINVVEIIPKTRVVKIGGGNSQGKTSVLDAIAVAIGGERMAPREPIRKGESEADISIALDNGMTVMRKFRRELLSENPQTWGPTRSTLVIQSTDGTVVHKSPQALLNKFLGDLSFDPLEFARLDKKPQTELLRKITGVDFTQIDQERQAAYDRRTAVNRDVAAKKAELSKMKRHVGVGHEPHDTSALLATLQTAKEKQTAYEDAVKAAAEAKTLLSQKMQRAKEIEEMIRKLETELDTVKEGIDAARKHWSVEETRVIDTRKAIPDTTEIAIQLAGIQHTNAKISDNIEYRKVERAVKALEDKADDETATVEACDIAKRNMVQNAKFPVPGLGFDAEGFATFNGLPLDQAGMAEQLRVSVAIGLALNPTLKVLLVRDGNLLESENMKLLSDLAEQHDAQIWMEYVTRDQNEVSVLIEDGGVVSK